MARFRVGTNSQRRSGFEERVGDYFKHHNIPVEYEPDKIKYTLPETKHTYTPDWKIRENVYIETKGKFTAEDRKKLLAVKQQHPNVVIYLLFQRAYNKLSPKSKTTYADWAEKNGFEWADYNEHEVPEKWLKS